MTFDEKFEHCLTESVDLTESQKLIVDQMNVVLSSLAGAPVLNPYYIVERAKDRIRSAFGLTFDDGYFRGDSGTIEKVLLPVQNINVHTFDKTSFESDNEYLKKFQGGLRIKFHFVKVKNLYHVHPEIVPGPSPEIISVTETEKKE